MDSHGLIVRNEEGRKRGGIERELASRVDQRVLRWVVHVNRMDENSTARRVLMAEVNGERTRGRPRWPWVAKDDGWRLLDNAPQVVRSGEP